MASSWRAKQKQIDSIISADERDPFSILGCHEVEGGVVIRAFLPEATRVDVVKTKKKIIPMEKIHNDGFFQLFIPKVKAFIPLFRLTNHEGHQWEIHDPWSFPPLLGEQDLHFHTEGSHTRAYEKLGTHIIEVKGIKGTSFAVWAPTARRVSIIGDFNQWDGRRHMMEVRGESGLWELFIPDLGQGEVYKYEIRTAKGFTIDKADPYSFASEVRPKTASVIWDVDHFKWTDKKWMKERRDLKPLESPMSIYEVHLGSWARNEDNTHRNYREIAVILATYINEMGYTHIELLPIAEHPFGGSWGYQITNFFAPTNRFGTPDDFAWFIDYLHSKDISVILDWVPAHFPKDPHALARYDGTCLYEHEDPRQGEHKDWGTLIFNYGREQVVTFLISNALYWLDRYHIDGLRVDAVASMLYLDYSKSDGEWVANKYGGKENLEAIDFIKKLNHLVHTEYPGVVTIAEESTSWPGVSRPTYTGGLGFTFKWNMGWMHDSLKYMQEDPIYRRWHHDKLTFALLYAFNENFVLVLSHDEVVHLKGSMINKMTGDDWQKFANLRALYAYMYATPGKKLLFMGADIAQWSEWNHQKSLDWDLVNYDPNHGINEVVKKLNNLYATEPALYEMCHESDGFQWIDFRDSDNSVISFLRKAKDSDDYIVVICNFTPQIHHDYRIGVPREGFHEEIFNSDSYIFWGANVGNEGGTEAEQIAWHDHMWSISVDIPPLGVLYLKPEPKPVVEVEVLESTEVNAAEALELTEKTDS